MAMNVGSGGDPQGDPDVMIDINTTPLIDVMLVLLVMLIITTPIQLHAVNLNMPVGTPPPTDKKPEFVKIDIDENSKIFWDGLPVENQADLVEKMKATAKIDPQPEIHLRPNKSARYAVVANVLADTKRIGLNKIGVIGAEQFVE